MSNTPKDNNAENRMIVQTSSLNEEMSDDELENIAAAGIIRGTTDDDIIFGTSGNDILGGFGGEDILFGGDGNDTLDGGLRDGANDVLMGGDGDDVAFWGPSRDGSDTFIGGDGHDQLRLDLYGTGHSSPQSAFESGYLTLTIEGDPDFIPEFDAQGCLILPEGASGIITGPTGETLTFEGVELIGKI